MMTCRPHPHVAVLTLLLVFTASTQARALAVSSRAAVADTPATSEPAANQAQVNAQLAALRRDLAQLRAQSESAPLDAERASQIRAIVEDVLADSGTRTSLQSESGSISGAAAVSGYQRGLGFFIGAPEADFRVEVFGFTQQRFVLNAGYDASSRTPPGDQQLWGFESRRNELFINGNAIDRSIQFLVGLTFDTHTDPQYVPSANGAPSIADGQQLELSYLNITKQLADGWFVQAGSIFTPWTFQSHLFCASNTQMGEYSPLEYLFGAAYTTGLNLGYGDEHLIWQLCYGDSIGLAPSPWNASSNQSVALSSRLNWKLAGSWEEYANETSFPGSPFGAFLGVAMRWQNGRAINSLPASTSAQVGATADLSIMFGGATLIAQGVYIDNYVQRGAGAWGALVQGGFFVSNSVELFASWSAMNAIGTQQYGNFGANWYIDRDSLKLTARVMVPVPGDQSNYYAVFLPAQGLLGGAEPNNSVSLVLQLQAAF